MEKEQEKLALDIATDPKNPWRQIICNRKNLPWYRTKYFVEGILEGKVLQVVLEPEGSGRGMLAVFDKDSKNEGPLSMDSKNVQDLMKELRRHISLEDQSLVYYFLYKEESQLGLEILCDILQNKHSQLNKEEIQKIKILSEKMNLDPLWTWKYLTYLDLKTGVIKYALQDEEGWKKDKEGLNFVLNNIANRLMPEVLESIEQDIYAGEYTLAAEAIFWHLIEDKIQISRLAFDKLKELGFLELLTEEDRAAVDQAVYDE